MSELTVRNVLASAGRMALSALSGALAELPNNGRWFTYTIKAFDGSPYITRTLFPRIGERRLLLHKIHRPDYDQCMHNHPWETAKFCILSGGYVEERLVNGRVSQWFYGPGDVNYLNAGTFHRVIEVLPNTWTLGLVGKRMQQWGFLVDNQFVESSEFFKRSNHIEPAGAGAS